MFTKTLPVTAAATAACAVLGAAASRDVDSDWYRSLAKPSFQPPGQVFGLVWTPLYADIAISSAVALDAAPDSSAATAYRRALGLNLLLNTGWSVVFFRLHRVGAAVAAAAALTASSADLARRTYAADRRAGLAIAPYAAWCGFATVLSAAIWRRNRG
ncbi:MAG TPA: TspO/MBR family protein [Dermatophilaceae bacterium]|nr:TspO/MBR family protein [Dermatophilaceae bacterium]